MTVERTVLSDGRELLVVDLKDFAESSLRLPSSVSTVFVDGGMGPDSMGQDVPMIGGLVLGGAVGLLWSAVLLLSRYMTHWMMRCWLRVTAALML